MSAEKGLNVYEYKTINVNALSDKLLQCDINAPLPKFFRTQSESYKSHHPPITRH